MTDTARRADREDRRFECPVCGSHRIRRVRGGTDIVRRLLTGKRRYRCTACGCVVWHSRLARRTGTARRRGRAIGGVTAGQVLFVAACLAALVFWFGIQSCGPPHPQPDSSTLPISDGTY